MSNVEIKRNYNLDLLKILACIAVVGLHTLNKDLSIVNSTLYYMCTFAVPVFFMTTGYIIWQRPNIKFGYSFSKIKSILRLVILWNIIFYCCEEIAKSVLIIVGGGENIILFDILRLLKQILKSLVQKGIVWQFWYLGALMIVYFLLPFLSSYILDKKNRFNSCLLILIICSIIIQILSYIQGTPIQENIIQTFRLWTWLMYFMLGGVMFDIIEIIKNKISLKIHSLILVIFTIWIVIYENVMGRVALHNLYAEYFYDSFSTIIWVCCLFTFVMRLNLSKRLEIIIPYLCNLTLGIYIVHPVIQGCLKIFIKFNTISMSIMQFILVLGLTSIVVYIINKTIFNKYLLKV